MPLAALVIGLAVYAVVGAISGLMSLGVGFMPEGPHKILAAHAIVFGPFVLTGLVIGCVARSRAVAVAAAVAVISFASFLALAPGPIPFVFAEHHKWWVPFVQGAYQAAVGIFACAVGAWASQRLRSTNAL